MATVFISYSHQNSDFAEVVQAKLQNKGHQVLMDEIVRAGYRWQQKLDQAIQDSHAVVVIMTPDPRASEYVAYEWAFALGARVRVIPIEYEKTNFPTVLEGLHRLEFTNKARPRTLLLEELEKAETSNPSTTIPIDPGMSPAVKQAVRGIDSLDSTERLAAVRTLGQTDEGSAREALVLALKHPVRDVRTLSIFASTIVLRARLFLRSLLVQ
jgi:TIR domain